jgi:hypothetical protein
MEIEFVKAQSIYEITDIVFGRLLYLDSAYDVAQYLLSDEAINPICIKKISTHRVVHQKNNESAS